MCEIASFLLETRKSDAMVRDAVSDVSELGGLFGVESARAPTQDGGQGMGMERGKKEKKKRDEGGETHG